MSGYRNGAMLGAAFSRWKRKHPVKSVPSKVVSKLGGLVGGLMQIAAAIGVIASLALEDVNIWILLLIAAGGFALEGGAHWIAMQIDKMRAS